MENEKLISVMKNEADILEISKDMYNAMEASRLSQRAREIYYLQESDFFKGEAIAEIDRYQRD